jgi:uncharacterized repeat protein (TIGR01451 family)
MEGMAKNIIERLVREPDAVTDETEILRIQRSEVMPDLTGSSLQADSLSASPGDEVAFTMTLRNTGNIIASDMDVINEVDAGFTGPEDFTFENCGPDLKNDSDAIVEISNVTVPEGGTCVIRYKVQIKPEAEGELVNSMFISPAAEGGLELGPIESGSLILHTE